MSKQQSNSATKSEVSFVKRLGNWSEQGSKLGRKACLDGYIQGAEKRTDWGNIDKNAVLKVAQTALAQ
ncbi:hypothetical protein A3I46_02605 [Candidatus Kaiserbacteria bacterium RIFCSPLOWO2_02_FULL_54_13]|uniref:Uncharacterized protein n=1 Tax=Candidatus Kaiserbacteria bacterium RIFCSPHIGHO2_02_FULL_54_22 TaxID=1798495 RepID=A0A1F6DLQ7_9BACT|nr:MAG: hypothetical protein UY91_C0027G0013 [Parcubacteria group bacterium GW2011_GWB1_55_9]OGG62326.1 MAG: hypothetical protein A3C19_03440 [Candidatus Kaiserbacteria bacterium RIFCSPHIGHO2_02_FULL_54_22]OGG68834.1 MAG: hypothetical protein A3E99_02850 [Candidatus Kaiserbacteria bacterium RIFCSPHIGHO2_12_FULL_54_16]OGG83839.1 MAG: hypothetical protein A3I46_02605 [Candidatus Kaiserbacteria bacterium RIFCSPLOWO2_02_FULL_54_13]OGG90144.1 MAG: hypothetical protein A3G12_03150 [Candidatus Kaiserb